MKGDIRALDDIYLMNHGGWGVCLSNPSHVGDFIGVLKTPSFGLGNPTLCLIQFSFICMFFKSFY